MATSGPILLVEDNEDDVFFMRQALREANIRNSLHVVEDGEQAVEYLSGTGGYADRVQYPLPVVVFLDLKLPLKSGHEVLGWIRRQAKFDPLLVFVLTSSNERADISRCYSLGASSYLVKPPIVEQLTELTRAFRGYWLQPVEVLNLTDTPG